MTTAADRKSAECFMCGDAFDPSDSIGSGFRLCQNCWEASNSASFWEVYEAIAFANANSRLTILTNGAAR